MATEIKDITPINGDSALGTMALYQKQQMDRQGELDIEMMAYALLAIYQMYQYWKKVKEHTEERDCAIGEYVDGNEGMLGFLFEIEKTRNEVDWGILQRKANVKNEIKFEEWKPNSCADATRYIGDLKNDVGTIEDMEQMFADCSCSGIPEGWGIHDGSLAFGLGAAYSGPIMNMAAVDMFEEFKQHVISIVQQAQMSMKGIYNISSVMKYYEQAISIREGLATMYLQGFNSAGAMLGTALERLGHAAAGSGTVINTSSIGGSSTTAIPIGTTASAGVRP